MASPSQSSKFTYDDYVLIPEDGKRHEIIDGEEYVSPSPRVKHQVLVQRLVTYLSNFLEQHGGGRVFVAPLDVVLSPEDVVQPDLLFISGPRLKILTEANVQGAPDLVIEILSENYRQRDEVIKRKRYEHFGVAEYWIVDPELQTVKVFRRGAAGYGRPTELRREAEETLTTPLLPGSALPLAILFR